jgi:hypothetical protein
MPTRALQHDVLQAVKGSPRMRVVGLTGRRCVRIIRLVREEGESSTIGLFSFRATFFSLLFGLGGYVLPQSGSVCQLAWMGCTVGTGTVNCDLLRSVPLFVNSL